MTASFQPPPGHPLTENARPLKISELAEKFGISLRTLRFYEEKGLLRPGRKDGWARLYREDDIARLDFILNCRSIGLSVEETRHLLEVKDRESEQTFLGETMEAIRSRVSAIAAELERIAEQQNAAKQWLKRLSEG